MRMHGLRANPGIADGGQNHNSFRGIAMSKSQNSRKKVKKEATKTMKEKKASKRDKKNKSQFEKKTGTTGP